MIWQRLRILGKLDRVLSIKLGRLGESVARSPIQYICFSFLVAGICITGLQQMYYESDPEYLFVPSGARSSSEKNVIKTLFPTNMSRYVRGAESRLHQVCDITLVPLEGAEILRPEIWDEVFRLQEAIKHIQVVHDGDLYDWNYLCVRFNGECVENRFLNLKDVLGVANLTYPIMHDTNNNRDYPLAAHVGGVSLSEGVLVSGRALKVTFIVDDSTNRKRIAGEIWIQTVRMYVSAINFNHIQAFAVTDKSIEEELSFNIDSSLGRVPISIFLVLTFSVYSCLSTDWVRSKPLIGVLSLVIAILSAASATGLCMYCGVKWQAINLITVFLLIGISFDDTFVVLSAWWRSEGQGGRDVVARVSMTYCDAAVSITITSLTNMISFAIGAVVPGFPCVQIFCVYAGMGILFLYVWTLTILGGFLALAGHLEHNNRHCLLFIKVKSKTEAEESGQSWAWAYSLFMKGGISRKDPTNARDNKEDTMMLFFRDSIAPVINNPWSKVIILVVFLGYLGLSVYGIMQLEEGLERSKLVGDYSYTQPAFKAEDQFFRDNPYRFQVVISEPLEYWNKTVQDQVFRLVTKLTGSKYISDDSAYLQSWLERFLDVAEKNFLFFDLSTPQLFRENLIKFLDEAFDTPLYDDVVFSKDKSEILASRFFIQSNRINDAKEEVDMLYELRDIVDSAPFNVTIYHPFFGFFDQFSQVKETTMNCLIACFVCMSVITILFIPNKVCVVWVTFTIMSVEVGVIGLMGLIGISLDVISMIVLIMGIGFSVDFSAHISYHYLSAGKGMSPGDRLSHCLYALGPPIVRAGLTSMLGVYGLATQPGYITQTFALMIFLIVSLGMVHGLFLLPVLLSLFGPGAADKFHLSKKDDLMSPSAVTLSETFVYQTTLSNSRPGRGCGLKKSSLRQHVLTGNTLDLVKDSALLSSNLAHHNGSKDDSFIRRMEGNFNSSQDSTDSWSCLDDLSRFNMVESFNLNPMRPRSKSLSSPSSELDRSKGMEGDPLPYYKFAHVKRTAYLPDSRNEHRDVSSVSVSDIKMQRKFPTNQRTSMYDLDEAGSSFYSSDGDYTRLNSSQFINSSQESCPRSLLDTKEEEYRASQDGRNDVESEGAEELELAVVDGVGWEEAGQAEDIARGGQLHEDGEGNEDEERILEGGDYEEGHDDRTQLQT